MTEVVALLLDDAMPPERLGALLLAARKRRGLKRKQAAAAAGTTAAKLRRYEHGDETVPADVCAQLAECYGEDLTAHVPLHAPLHIASDSLSVGDVRATVGSDADDVIGGYIDIVHRLRHTAPGDPLSLRTADIVALAAALGRDRRTIEARIVEVLGCSPAEARSLHSALLRRKVILPVAGLAAGMAAFAGAAYATQSSSTPAANINTQIISAARAPSTTSTTTPPTIVTTPTTATPPTTAPRTPPATVPAPRVHVEQHTPAVTPALPTDATVPAAQQPADDPVTIAPPQADPNDPPVSVLPGETPITVIGTPDSTSNTP